MIPTYNERDNIGALLEKILALDIPGHRLKALVVDDSSPDGTGAIVSEFAKKDERVQLLTRTKKRGRGNAGIEGFLYSLNNGADYVIEMDADLSHNPQYLPDLIKAADSGADVVLGSRFVKGGADKDRGLYRQLVTKVAGFYVRTLLKINIRDVSSGYRCFKRKVLESLDLENLVSTGPSIVLEILFLSILKGWKITEVPIVFIDRRQGKTKLNWITLLETMVMVLRLRELRKRGVLSTSK